MSRDPMGPVEETHNHDERKGPRYTTIFLMYWLLFITSSNTAVFFGNIIGGAEYLGCVMVGLHS